jgi:inorganic pyrophosphatase
VAVFSTRGKMEIATKEEFNPIKQDVKKGELRYFKLGDIPFNYGCLPQTWEDPAFAHPDTRLGGDNDPIDAVEIGPAIACGVIAPVKVLGVLAMIDEGETDWKVLVISRAHPLASKMNSASLYCLSLAFA